MSYDEKERSREQNSPLEFYRFSMGSQLWRFTAADVGYHVAADGDEAYQVERISRTELDYSQEDSAANVTVTVPRANPVAQLFGPYIPPTPVGLIIYRRHRTDPDGEEVALPPFKVLSASFEGGDAKLLCAPVSNVLKQVVPRLVQISTCNWAVFEPGCGLDREDFRTDVTLDDVAGVALTSTGFDALADGWFTRGYIEIASGPRTGERRFVIAHLGALVTLQNPFPADVVAGATVKAYPGCNGDRVDCVNKFNNLRNRMAWDEIPNRNPYGGQSID